MRAASNKPVFRINPSSVIALGTSVPDDPMSALGAAALALKDAVLVVSVATEEFTEGADCTADRLGPELPVARLNTTC